MEINEIFKTLKIQETKIIKLYQQEKILRVTLNVIRRKIELITRNIGAFHEKSDGNEINIGSISSQLIILDDMIRAITEDKYESNAKILAQELLEKIEEDCSIEVFLTESTTSISTLWNLFSKEGNQLTFFLFFPSSDYVNADRIGLIAHETAHAHEIVEKYTQSINSRKRKIGESFADILGLYVAGLLFAKSFSFITTEDIEKDRLAEIYDVHPSWIARVIILHYVNARIWETKIIRNIIHDLTKKVLRRTSPHPSENFFIAKCIKEYEGHAIELADFRIDEKKIINFKNGEDDSLLYMLNARCLR
jgi:hypothetical protein